MYSIDLPGHGKSEKLKSRDCYNFDILVNWLEYIVKQIECDKFTLVGHSWGAYLALFYASTYNQLIENVILIDGGYIDKKLLYEKCKSEREKIDLLKLELKECDIYDKIVNCDLKKIVTMYQCQAHVTI